MTEKEAILKKLKALADRGEGGERENAAALLEKLMQKYGISEEELNREREQDYFFSYSQETTCLHGYRESGLRVRRIVHRPEKKEGRRNMHRRAAD